MAAKKQKVNEMIAKEAFESAHQNMIDTYPEEEQNQELLKWECQSAVCDLMRWIEEEGTTEAAVMAVIDEMVKNSGY